MTLTNQATEPGPTAARDALRRSEFASFLTAHRSDVVTLLAASRRVGLTDAARYCALDTFFVLVHRLPQFTTGPRSRHLAIAACISLAVKLVERLIIFDRLLNDIAMKRHNVRKDDVNNLEQELFVALDGLVMVPQWWMAMEATMDAPGTLALAKGAVRFVSPVDPQRAPNRTLATVAVNTGLLRVASKKDLRDDLPPAPPDAAPSGGRRELEAAMRTLGMVVDRLLLDIAFNAPLTLNDAKAGHSEGHPCGIGDDRATADDRLLIAASIWWNPCAAFACLVVAGIGLAVEDASCFGICGPTPSASDSSAEVQRAVGAFHTLLDANPDP